MKYYYNKYNISDYYYWDSADYQGFTSGIASFTGYAGVELDTHYGTSVTYGVSVTKYQGDTGSVYTTSGSGASIVKIVRSYQGGDDLYRWDYDLLVKDVAGSFVETVEAEDGTYPDDGVQSGYWWIKGDSVFPDVSVNVSGTWKSCESMAVNVSGTWKNVTNIYKKISGTWTEL